MALNVDGLYVWTDGLLGGTNLVTLAADLALMLLSLGLDAELREYLSRLAPDEMPFPEGVDAAAFAYIGPRCDACAARVDRTERPR